MDSAGFLVQTACALHRQGVHVEVVTPRYKSSCPEHFMFREIAVHLPAAAPRSDWSMGRYIRHLSSWLRQRANTFDVMLVDAIRDESVAAIEASRSTGCVTILRASRWGIHRDPQWWQTSRLARRCGATGRLADAVVAKSAACQRALLADGYAENRIRRIDHGFAAGPSRSAEARRLARKALCRVNSDLSTHQDSQVVICTARMTRDSGVNLLVKAARQLVARHPDLRLWFIGDGPHRDWMYETLRGEGVRASIAMPGSFCDVDDLFAAADVFLQADDEGLDYFLPSAIAAGLPIVAVDSESTRAVISVGSDSSTQAPLAANDPDSLVQWCPGATSKYIRMGILRVLEDLPEFQARASRLRRLLVRSRPQSKTITAYTNLMAQLTDRSSLRHRQSSVEAMS